MRHFVNLALIPIFITLVVTGILRFLFPFSLVTTQVHIIFGFALLLLIGLHLASRVKYFSTVINSANNNKSHRQIITYKTLFGVIGLWAILLGASIWGLPPASQVIDLSYESRHTATIFRTDPQTVFEPVNNGLRVKRATDSDASLLVHVDWGDAFPSEFTGTRDPLTGSPPQIAIWTESTTGSLIETLFLSEEVAFSENLKWGGYEQRRVDILPIWRNRITLTTGITPEGEQTEFFSGATPEHSFSVHTYLRTDSSPFYLYVEINVPENSNDFYHENHEPGESGYTRPGIGQPSVLYGVRINPTEERQWRLLQLIGHGGSGGTSDGSINYDTENLTTAMRAIEKVLIRVQRTEPPEKENDEDIEILEDS